MNRLYVYILAYQDGYVKSFRKKQSGEYVIKYTNDIREALKYANKYNADDRLFELFGYDLLSSVLEITNSHLMKIDRKVLINYDWDRGGDTQALYEIYYINEDRVTLTKIGNYNKKTKKICSVYDTVDTLRYRYKRVCNKEDLIFVYVEKKRVNIYNDTKI